MTKNLANNFLSGLNLSACNIFFNKYEIETICDCKQGLCYKCADKVSNDEYFKCLFYRKQTEILGNCSVELI